MPNKSTCTPLGCALAIIFVFGAIALITDKLCCHLISFYATFSRPRRSCASDAVCFDESPFDGE